jgi:hypothetical protein
LEDASGRSTSEILGRLVERFPLNWQEFAHAQPEMARFGESRLQTKVMYLATIKPDGYPRVHPFTPFVGGGRLFAFMEPTSPKGKDLQRNGRYSMHSLVTDMNGSGGEFQLTGDAHLVTDPGARALAISSCPYKPQDRYVLFEFEISSCLTNDYVGGKSNAKRWKVTDLTFD